MDKIVRFPFSKYPRLIEASLDFTRDPRVKYHSDMSPKSTFLSKAKKT